MIETKEKLIQFASSVQGKFTLSEDDLDAGSVGAALITQKGNIYTGICIDLACGIGFCAEHSAIAEMLKNRETKIEMIVAVGKRSILAPCGRCREIMMQLDKENRDTKVIISKDEVVNLNQLIPNYWKD
ncbi:cytidine deaminase family protein [Haloplasma contractile]|uniref:Cytidine deaminase protein n=1 Tax=Haloplasma contractile SSD-17B TaxID=1033810 RepID=F7PTQ2_9MOLU|nr:cytidine deaminase [Haloplasma contractile]ERJ12215.1 cytidine deaminase protein [Haloplasma contractile SSD-17B]